MKRLVNVRLLQAGLCLFVLSSAAHALSARQPKPSPAPAPTPAATGKAVTSGEIMVRLPGPQWESAGAQGFGAGVMLTRKDADRSRSLGFLVIDVPPELKKRSRKQHIEGYFAYERQMERPDGPWTGFTEGQRKIGTVTYPTMSYQFRPTAAPGHVMDGIFLLVFPPDFEKRQRFYVALWGDFHLKSEKPVDLEEMDAILGSLRIGPVVRPKPAAKKKPR